MLNVSLIVISP